MNRNEAFRKRNPETARPHENLKESIYTLLRSRAINPDKLLKKEPKVKVTLQFDSQTKGRIPTEVITFVNEQAPGRNIEIDTIETNFKRFLDPYSRTYKESSSIVITNINPEKREEIANRIVIDITPGMISYDVISQSEGEEVKGKAIDPQVVSAITSMIPDLPKGKDLEPAEPAYYFKEGGEISNFIQLMKEEISARRNRRKIPQPYKEITISPASRLFPPTWGKNK